MKKTLRFILALVALLSTLQASAMMYIVGDGPFGGWSPSNGVPMNAKADGTYTYTTVVSGKVYFVFADGLASSPDDWDTFNSNYRYGPAVSDQAVPVNSSTWTTTQKAGDHGAYYFTGNGSNYLFTFDTINKRFKVSTTEPPVNPVTGHLYILGEADGNVWNPTVGYEMSTTDGNLFTAQVTFNGEWNEEDANVSYFSFTSKLGSSSSDWDGIAPYRLTPVSQGNYWVTSTSLGEEIPLNNFGDDIDVSFRIPAGTYTITVDVANLTCVITRENGGGPAPGTGWPAMYGGVMLQGFYWDSYKATRWTNMIDHVQDLGQYFDVVWVPNSGSIDANGTSQSMGYMPVYWLKHNTCFGTEAQLREMIDTFHAHNTNVIMDMVINHKSGKSGWVDFPDETVVGPVTGEEYSMTWSLADICKTDECVAQGYAATGAADEGEDFDGSRDLDHTSANVQKNVKTYQKYLIDELGYDGFRYDMCKGYAGYYTGLYNAASQPTFSVGEYWDGNAETLRWWLNETKQNNRIQSAVFDFSLKYPMQHAFAGGTWSALNDKGLAADPNYQRYSVTFVDNHDTGQNTNYDCLKTNVMPANAFILAMPGTPCIFYKHYNVYTNEINNCIKARRAAGIHNQSAILTQQESNGGYILETQGTRGNLYLQVGYAVMNGTPSGYTLVQGGDAYNLFISNGIDWKHVGKDGRILGYPVVSKAAGNYVGSVTLTVAPSATGTTLVYTTDGSVPTTASATLTASTAMTFTENTTLKVGVLNGNQVENIESYVYTITDAATTGINVYVKTSLADAYVWAWTSEGSVTGSSWPGKAISSLDKVTVNDIEWYCLHVDADQLSLVFNTGEWGFENQTSVIDVTRDSYFIYPNSDLTGLNYTAADTYIDVTERYAGMGSASFSTVYVLGNINTTGWAPNNGVQMTTTNGEKYTATIDFVDPYGGYSYFSFSKSLGQTWNDIEADRMGATSNNFLINEARLGTELPVVPGSNAFRIPVGKYNLTFYLTNSVLVVDRWTEPIIVVRGDVNKDGDINIADVTALIDYLLSGNAQSISVENADCNQDSHVTISDVTALIDRLLTGSW
ncbi:MAG: chitobiase/beta-hexosaminidase C-terminal domain-containing protein [Muribaculaceae bacterium]|nr:chitobiase/beta-hexosaminidase C-terminal domain-containing protein [Muribaculaceae bacterium]